MNATKYILYCRKSTESEDRQVQSIEDQQNALNPIIQQQSLNVVQVFEESKSAKQPGRPQFDEMVRMIRDGQADGIICWKLNRLARNPRDGGEIQWLLQQGVLKSIVTASREYLPSDNVIMMAVELGMANQFVLDLSLDVSRGMKAKAEKGWRPGRAPIGYKKDKFREKGEKQVLVDEERFPLVRRMWDYFLTGNYTASELHRIASEDWGLTNTDNRPLSRSGFTQLLRNPFYYGEFTFSGEVYKGKHKPMITPEEFDIAQELLNRAGRPRPKHKRLPLTGLIECGECQGMITCDEKIKKLKTTGQYKKYLYYRCTRKKRDKTCHQSPISGAELSRQILKILDGITISEEFREWAVAYLRAEHRIEQEDSSLILKNLNYNYQSCVERLNNLLDLYLSKDNASGLLLSKEEYLEQKKRLIKEQLRLETEKDNLSNRVQDWLTLAENVFELATHAKQRFDEGDTEEKTKILNALGKRFILKDKKLWIELEEPFLKLKEGLQQPDIQADLCELRELGEDKVKKRAIFERSIAWSSLVLDVRNIFTKDPEHIKMIP